MRYAPFRQRLGRHDMNGGYFSTLPAANRQTGPLILRQFN